MRILLEGRQHELVLELAVVLHDEMDLLALPDLDAAWHVLHRALALAHDHLNHA